MPRRRGGEERRGGDSRSRVRPKCRLFIVGFLLVFFAGFSVLVLPVALTNFRRQRTTVVGQRDRLAERHGLQTGSGLSLLSENGRVIWLVSPQESHPVPVATLGRDSIGFPSYGGIAISGRSVTGSETTAGHELLIFNPGRIGHLAGWWQVSEATKNRFQTYARPALPTADRARLQPLLDRLDAALGSRTRYEFHLNHRQTMVYIGGHHLDNDAELDALLVTAQRCFDLIEQSFVGWGASLR